jgi:hypothetical protein
MTLSSVRTDPPGRAALLEDVEAGAGNPPLLQRLGQRLVDDRPARGVDQIRRRLHQGELAAVDEVAGRRRERHADREDVGPAKDILEARELDAGSAATALSA